MRLFVTIPLFLFLLLSAGCTGRGKQRAVGYAYAGPASFNLRAELGLRAQTTATVEHGERLEILETRRKFVRVRTPDGAEGWTDSSYLLTQQQMDDLNLLAARAKELPSQGEATVFDTLNVHTAASRTSASFAQIQEGDRIHVLSHRVAERALPGGGTSADDWFLIRNADNRAGWVLSRMVLMNVPDEVAQYANREYIMSYHSLGDDAWLWATSAKARQPYDYDGVRVFVYNERRKSYETVFTQRNLRGYFPLEANALGDMFSFVAEEPDGTLSRRFYTFNGSRVKPAAKEAYERPPALPEVTTPKAFDATPPKQDNWADKARNYASWWLGI